MPLVIVAPTNLHAAATRAQSWFSGTRWNYLYAANMSGIRVLHPQQEDMDLEAYSKETAIYHHTDAQTQAEGVAMLQRGIAKI